MSEQVDARAGLYPGDQVPVLIQTGEKQEYVNEDSYACAAQLVAGLLAQHNEVGFGDIRSHLMDRSVKYKAAVKDGNGEKRLLFMVVALLRAHVLHERPKGTGN